MQSSLSQARLTLLPLLHVLCGHKVPFQVMSSPAEARWWGATHAMAGQPTGWHSLHDAKQPWSKLPSRRPSGVLMDTQLCPHAPTQKPGDPGTPPGIILNLTVPPVQTPEPPEPPVPVDPPAPPLPPAPPVVPVVTAVVPVVAAVVPVVTAVESTVLPPAVPPVV